MRSPQLISTVSSVTQLYGLLKSNVFVKLPFTKDMIEVDPDSYSLFDQPLELYNSQGMAIGNTTLETSVMSLSCYPEDILSNWLRLPRQSVGIYLYHRYNKFNNWYAVSEQTALFELKNK